MRWVKALGIGLVLTGSIAIWAEAMRHADKPAAARSDVATTESEATGERSNTAAQETESSEPSTIREEDPRSAPLPAPRVWRTDVVTTTNEPKQPAPTEGTRVH